MTGVEVAIVGGGIIGCLIARELITRTPSLSVAVLDRDLVGSGASRRSAGVHFPRGATQRIREMAGVSQDHYERLLAENPALPIYPLSMCLVAADVDRVGRDYLSRANLTRIPEVPGGKVTAPDGTAIWLGDGCHYADVGALTVALATGMRSRVRFHEGVAVVGIEQDADQVTLRLGTGESLDAATVVLAPGPWLDAPAWRSLTGALDVRVKLVVALHLDRPPEPQDQLIVFHDQDAFLLPARHRGHWVFSYTSQQWDVSPDGLRDGLTDAGLAEGRAALAACAPRLVELATAGRVFCDAYSARREPLVQSLGGDPRIVFAGAGNGSGYRLAPAIAAEAADLIQLGLRQRTFA